LNQIKLELNIAIPTDTSLQLARDLEVLAAMREQIELQKDLLQREYAISTGQDEPLSHEQAGHVRRSLSIALPLS
jgi:hypothetical protein